MKFSTTANEHWAIYIVCLFVILQSVGLAIHASRSSPTSDEYGHYFAGMRYWQSGDTQTFNVNPPLIRAIGTLPAYLTWGNIDLHLPDSDYLPLNRPEFTEGRHLYAEHSKEFFRTLVWGRYLVSFFAVMATVVLFLWGRAITGPWAGIIASGLWAFQPQILSHGSLITNDVAVTACMLLASWCFCRWLESPTITNSMLGGLTLGIATLCKFTALLLWPIFGAFTLYMLWRTRSKAVALQALFAISISLAVVALPYRCAGVGTPIANIALPTDFRFNAESEQWESTSRFKDSWLGRMPSPLPAQFVIGMDRQQFDFVDGLHSYAAGMVGTHGWWWFYIYSMLVKLPDGTWLTILTAAVFWLRGSGQIKVAHLLILSIAIGMLEITAYKSGFAQQHRYIFPLYPFLFLLISTAFERVSANRWYPRLLGAGLTLTAVAALSATPHWLSFINIAAGGSTRGYKYLFNDATDWGQDSFLVSDWINRNPQYRPIEIHSMNGFSGVALSVYNLPADIYQLNSSESKTMPLVSIPFVPWHIVSSNDLAAYSEKSFQAKKPILTIGTTHFLYAAENHDTP